MQAYTELTPPTGVTHAVNLPFLGPKANNLVIAKSSLLQLFETKNVTAEVARLEGEDGTLSCYSLVYQTSSDRASVHEPHSFEAVRVWPTCPVLNLYK